MAQNREDYSCPVPFRYFWDREAVKMKGPDGGREQPPQFTVKDCISTQDQAWQLSLLTLKDGVDEAFYKPLAETSRLAVLILLGHCRRPDNCREGSIALGKQRRKLLEENLLARMPTKSCLLDQPDYFLRWNDWLLEWEQRGVCDV